MALEVLKEINKVDGFEILHIGNERTGTEFIEIDDEENSIKFIIQKGAIKESGINGCQIDTIIKTAKAIITRLDEKFSCDHNKSAVYHLGQALIALTLRKADRIERGVEGYEKV